MNNHRHLYKVCLETLRLCADDPAPDDPDARSKNLTHCANAFEAAIEDAEALRAKLAALAKYFTSGNDVPVERATIRASDFWAIVGEGQE